MKRLVGVCFSAVLAGCSDAELPQLNDTLAEIRRAPEGLPSETFELPPTPQRLDYRHREARSPFLALESAEASLMAQSHGEPALHPSRTPEPLESFALHSLRLVGTLRLGEQWVALIALPSNEVVSVRKGAYLGLDSGQVARIGPREIAIVERVFSHQQGWQSRPAALSLDE